MGDYQRFCEEFNIPKYSISGGFIRAALGEFEMEQGYWLEGKDADIHDVKIRNVSSDPYVCSIIRLLNENGHQLYNVEIQGVTDLRQNEAYQSQNTVRIGDLFVLARRALPCP